MPQCHRMDNIRIEVASDKYTDENSSDTISDLQGTVLWPKRSLLYRIGFLVLIPLFLIFLLGFSSPFWMKKFQVEKFLGHYNDVELVDVSIGLWQVCQGLDFSEIKDCKRIESTPYIRSCQAMMCLCLIFTVFSLIIGLYENFASRYDVEEGNESKTKRPEVNAILAGIFGMIGISQYGVLIINDIKGGNVVVQWGFPLTAAAVTGIIVCGIIMAVANPLHAIRPGYPGQVLSVYRQDPTPEPNIQDRLVSTPKGTPPPHPSSSPTGASGSMYGVTKDHLEFRERSRVLRSDSMLSSHMSSPDIYTSANTDSEFPLSTLDTHVVETYDVNAHATNGAKRLAIKQSLQSKAAKRRSWHFDKRNSAYIFSDLINDRPNPAGQSEKPNVQKNSEGMKPPVPPRRDKMTNQVNGNTSSAAQSLKTTQDQTADLMLLEDPMVTAPTTKEQNDNSPSINRRSKNPFFDDNHVNTAETAIHISNTESWENTPWPEPPKMNEMFGSCASAAHTFDSSNAVENNESANDVPTNSVPESLQYQPQRSASLSRKRNYDTRPPPSHKSLDSFSDIKPSDPYWPQQSAGRPNKHNTKVGGRKAPRPPPNEPRVPILKEYDNPLFKPKQYDDDSGDFSLQICDSTSFVQPEPEPPPYSVVRNTRNDRPAHKRQSELFGRNRSATIDNAHPSIQFQKQISKDLSHEAKRQGRVHPKSPKIDGINRHSAQTHTKTKNAEKNIQTSGAKSRPRQVKREHQLRRSGNPDTSQSPLQQTYYSSNPDLVKRSPLMNRARREGLAGPKDTTSPLINGRQEQSSEYRSNVYEQDASRSSPYYSNQGHKYSHCDSDL